MRSCVPAATLAQRTLLLAQNPYPPFFLVRSKLWRTALIARKGAKLLLEKAHKKPCCSASAAAFFLLFFLSVSRLCRQEQRTRYLLSQVIRKQVKHAIAVAEGAIGDAGRGRNACESGAPRELVSASEGRCQLDAPL